MNKEKVRKIIPYVLIVIAVISTLYSFAMVQSSENRCNEHWIPQINEYKDQVQKWCPTQQDFAFQILKVNDSFLS